MTTPTDPRRTLEQIQPTELAALITVETVECIAAKTAQAIEAGDTARAYALLAALVDETTTRTATAIKAQDASDYIARQASQITRRLLALVDAQLEEEAAEARRLEAEHEAATERSVAEHEADLATRLDY